MAQSDYNALAKGILKAEMKRRGLTYKDLARKLGELGVNETDRNLSNKISRGGFSAAFFLMCLNTIGVDVIQLNLD